MFSRVGPVVFVKCRNGRLQESPERLTEVRGEFHQLMLQEVVKTVMGGEPDAMLAAFIGVAENVGPKKLEQLEALVAERLRRRKAGSL